MKGLAILLSALAVLLVSQAAVVKAPAPASRVGLNVGYPQAGDILFYSQIVAQQPISNAIQHQDVTYRGNFNTRITSIWVLEIGYTHYANAQIVAGGLGYNYVTIRITSARGYGYNYAVSVWGR